MLSRDAHSVLVRAVWTRPTTRLPFTTFERGDILHESFYDDRWYNVFELRTSEGRLKGWYADVTRPARITAERLDWEDLLLDIWMGPDGAMQVLDEDEFAAAVPQLPAAEATIARATLAPLGDELRRRYRDYLNDQIAITLKRRGWTLGTAESCTGGLIGDELTNRPGSSDYFKGGIISYDNRIKQQVLGVQPETLSSVGAVSEQCALEMARGVRRASGRGGGHQRDGHRRAGWGHAWQAGGPGLCGLQHARRRCGAPLCVALMTAWATSALPPMQR